MLGFTGQQLFQYLPEDKYSVLEYSPHKIFIFSNKYNNIDQAPLFAIIERMKNGDFVITDEYYVMASFSSTYVESFIDVMEKLNSAHGLDCTRELRYTFSDDEQKSLSYIAEKVIWFIDIMEKELNFLLTQYQPIIPEYMRMLTVTTPTSTNKIPLSHNRVINFSYEENKTYSFSLDVYDINDRPYSKFLYTEVSVEYNEGELIIKDHGKVLSPENYTDLFKFYGKGYCFDELGCADRNGLWKRCVNFMRALRIICI